MAKPLPSSEITTLADVVSNIVDAHISKVRSRIEKLAANDQHSLRAAARAFTSCDEHSATRKGSVIRIKALLNGGAASQDTVRKYGGRVFTSNVPTES